MRQFSNTEGNMLKVPHLGVSVAKADENKSNIGRTFLDILIVLSHLYIVIVLVLLQLGQVSLNLNFYLFTIDSPFSEQNYEGDMWPLV